MEKAGGDLNKGLIIEGTHTKCTTKLCVGCRLEYKCRIGQEKNHYFSPLSFQFDFKVKIE